MITSFETNILVYRYDPRFPEKQRIATTVLREELASGEARVPILYPNEAVVRTALRGEAAYGLSCFDAHLWAYAEIYGLAEILSEDFQHGRMYGTVTVRNPFVAE